MISFCRVIGQSEIDPLRLPAHSFGDIKFSTLLCAGENLKTFYRH